jgi:hypothetical protein
MIIRQARVSTEDQYTAAWRLSSGPGRASGRRRF